MATVYRKFDGKPMEVSDSILAELKEFETGSRSILADLSSEPVPDEQTHMGMMGLGRALQNMQDRQAAEEHAKRQEEERRKLEAPPLDPSKGADWAGLVED